jgi:hypothetical protein
LATQAAKKYGISAELKEALETYIQRKIDEISVDKG